MAQTSGRLDPSQLKLPSAEFASEAANIRYRVSPSPAGVHMSFAHEGSPETGSRELSLFIGSGRVGRSFLFETPEGFIYQAPVSWYTEARKWALSPGFDKDPAVDLTRPIEPACLQCHTTGLRHVNGSQNRYADPPFAGAGIGCERCHGDGARHIERMKMAVEARPSGTAIVNPVKLDPERRDSVCSQCHLTGAARITRTNRRNSTFTPGDLLSDSLAIFVWSDAKNAGLTVTSHVEKLALSRCRQASGDRLWCGTCHDPHGDSEGVALRIRGQCVQCHTQRTCTLPMPQRREKGDLCQTCHMPKAGAGSLRHAVYTDHSIPRKPVPVKSENKGELVSFWARPAEKRDVALALAVAALDEPSVRKSALEHLEAVNASNPGDPQIIAQLAQFYDRMRQPHMALPLFERAHALDPANGAATVNLGSLYAQAGRLDEAIRMWEDALRRNPALTRVRLNVAVARLRLGDRSAGLAEIRKALEYDPDSPIARRMLTEASGQSTP